jgi:anti-sigma B factor antagonist
MTEITFPIALLKDVPVIAVPDEIDVSNAGRLQASLAEAACGHPTVVVDMTGTKYCDSAGLHTLVHAHKRAVADGGGLLLAVQGASVLRILAITGIGQMIPVFPSVEEALARPRAGPPSGIPDAPLQASGRHGET